MRLEVRDKTPELLARARKKLKDREGRLALVRHLLPGSVASLSRNETETLRRALDLRRRVWKLEV